MPTPIEYLEARIKALKMERPLTVDGHVGRDEVIHELQNCVFALQLQALQELLVEQQQAFKDLQ